MGAPASVVGLPLLVMFALAEIIEYLGNIMLLPLGKNVRIEHVFLLCFVLFCFVLV